MREGLTLLYVEDEELVRDEMVEILELDFEQIYVAKNGQEGLRLYQEHSPDLVISDIQMPVLDGISMAKKILSINAEAKIILTSAFNEQDYFDAVKEIGISYYVNKPVNISELFEKIEEITS